MIKKLFQLILILALIAGGAFGAGWAYVLSAFRGGIEKAMTYALQVDVRMDDLKLRPFDGILEVGDLVIGNPEGFETRSAFQIVHATIHADLRSFTTDSPVIHLIEIDKPKVTFERGLRTSNLKELIANASRFQLPGGGETSPDPQAPEASKMKIQIEKVVIDGAEVALSAPILRGLEVLVPLNRIEMNDVGGGGKRVGVAELLKLIIDRILTQTLSQGGSKIPSGF